MFSNASTRKVALWNCWEVSKRKVYLIKTSVPVELGSNRSWKTHRNCSHAQIGLSFATTCGKPNQSTNSLFFLFMPSAGPIGRPSRFIKINANLKSRQLRARALSFDKSGSINSSSRYLEGKAPCSCCNHMPWLARRKALKEGSHHPLVDLPRSSFWKELLTFLDVQMR